MTAAALAFYAPGILGYSIVKIASPSFYSLREVAHAGPREPGDHRRQPRAEPVAEFDLTASRASRSARRSRPTSTPCCCCFLSRRLGGIELRAHPAHARSRSRVASAAMGVAAYYTPGVAGDGLRRSRRFWHRLIRVGRRHRRRARACSPRPRICCASRNSARPPRACSRIRRATVPAADLASIAA